MAAGLTPPGPLIAVPGVRLACGSAGLYPSGRPDLCLLEAAPGTTASAVFTRNAFRAAPVCVAESRLRRRNPRFCLVNAGNANAGCGEVGLLAALETCRRVAEVAGCSEEEVLPFSTGVIGQPMPVKAITDAIPGLHARLGEDTWLDASTTIMTTDRVPKAVSEQVSIGGVDMVVTGMAKGSGMIHPNLATMLAFIATDAPVSTDALNGMLRAAVSTSFNRISVDGSTSTNDAVLLLATGRARLPVIGDASGGDARRLADAVGAVCTHLAQSIVRDGEGATKFMTVRVDEGADTAECLKVAGAVAASPLVKTAFYASDPNWGRILAAVGAAGLEHMDVSKIFVTLNGVAIVEGGARAASYTEEAGKRVMSETDIVIHVRLGRGSAGETVWTCDLSHGYVRINAEYRS